MALCEKCKNNPTYRKLKKTGKSGKRRFGLSHKLLKMRQSSSAIKCENFPYCGGYVDE